MSAVDFSLLPEEIQQHFRLLELPAELLELLTSNDAPTLHFKSTDQSSGEAAVICTPTKTYNIRQVNTSNSVYVCEAYQPRSGDDKNAYRLPGLQGVAQSTFTLELDQVKHAPAVPYLQAALPLYSSTGTYQSKELKNKQQHFNDIPISQAECQDTWRELACFEMTEPAGSFLPSANAKVSAWCSILQQAEASGFDLTSPLSASQADVLINPSEEWPVELSQAVLRSVSSTTGNGLAIDKDRCIRIIGENTLAASSQGRPMSLDNFLTHWQDSLPEKWRAKAHLEALPKDRYTLDNDGKLIASVDYGRGDAAAASAANEAKSVPGAKRKWHEKFRASKKPA